VRPEKGNLGGKWGWELKRRVSYREESEKERLCWRYTLCKLWGTQILPNERGAGCARDDGKGKGFIDTKHQEILIGVSVWGNWGGQKVGGG